MSSADNLCKQSGHRSGPTKNRAWSESKLFDTLMVFLKSWFRRNSTDDKKAHGKLPSRQNVNRHPILLFFLLKEYMRRVSTFWWRLLITWSVWIQSVVPDLELECLTLFIYSRKKIFEKENLQTKKRKHITIVQHARIQKVCQRRFNVFLVDEGRGDQNTTISGPLLAGQRTAIKWRFAGWLMMT